MPVALTAPYRIVGGVFDDLERVGGNDRGVHVAVVQNVANRLQDVILSLVGKAFAQRQVQVVTDTSQTVRQVVNGFNNIVLEY